MLDKSSGEEEEGEATHKEVTAICIVFIIRVMMHDSVHSNARMFILIKGMAQIMTN